MAGSSTASDPRVASTIEPHVFRHTMGHFATGVTIIAGLEGESPVGLTCQSFASVSLEPPLISFSVGVRSQTYPRLRAIGRFTVSVLGSDQRHLARQFSQSGADKWRGVDWTLSANGSPRIRDAIMWVDATLEWEKRAGDHEVVVGHVTGLGVRDEASPLLFYRGAFHGIGDIVG